MKNRAIKLIAQGGTAFVVFYCFHAMRKEKIVQEAKLIRDQQLRYGGQFNLTPERQKVLDQADDYLQNHVGLKYLNRTRTRQFLQERVTQLIQQKKQQLTKIKEQNQTPQKLQLKNQIQQLNKAYNHVRLKYSSLKDLEQPEIEQDESKYYEKK